MTVHALEVAHRSHIGPVRQLNEDYLVVLDDLGILVLADGMGGHCAGEIASKVAVEAAAAELAPAQRKDAADDLESLLRVGQAVEAANAALFRAVADQPTLQGMGTTLVLAMFRQDRVYFAHVGDSRLYRVRDGHIRRLTRDHTLVQQLLDQGVFQDTREARAAGIGDNILTRTLGMDPDVEVDLGDRLLRAGDIYLACSDGLTGNVSDQDIAGILSGENIDLEVSADELLVRALEAGGRDNISLVLARPRL